MRRVVPDASIILKWVLPAERESHVKEALDLLDAFTRAEVELLVPALWLYEVGNTVARRHPEFAGEIMSDLLALEMEEPQRDAAFVAEAVRLASRYAVTFYDAAYHALARCRDAQFVSADQRYLDAVAAEPGAMHIAEWR